MLDTNTIDVVPGIATISDEWMHHLPSTLRDSFINARVRSSIAQLSDETPLTQDLASLYLDVSDATLKRMRANSTGPEYVQGQPEDGGKSRNQKVMYTLGSLKDWIQHNKTTSTGHATIRRGLMFGSLADVLIPEPWWVKNELIQCHGYLGFEFFEKNEFEVVWFTVQEALSRTWSNTEQRLAFDDLYSALLSQCIAQQQSAQEATHIDSIIE